MIKSWRTRSMLLLLGLVGLALAFSDTDATTLVRKEKVLRGLVNAKANERNLQCTSPRQLLQSGQSLNVGDEVFTSDYYASIKQEANGNLVVKRASDGITLCESGISASFSFLPYFTTLYGDGNLITWNSPDETAPAAWKSNVVGPTFSTYFLAVDCDDSVSIYQDSVYGSVLWTCPSVERNSPPDTPVPSPEPTPAPTQDPVTATSSTTTTAITTKPKTTTTTPEPNAVTTFCVVADAPYRYKENLALLEQVESMDPECEFVAHLGDIRSARNFDTCVQETYTNASLIMKRSQKPVLMMLGGECLVF